MISSSSQEIEIIQMISRTPDSDYLSALCLGSVYLWSDCRICQWGLLGVKRHLKVPVGGHWSWYPSLSSHLSHYSGLLCGLILSKYVGESRGYDCPCLFLSRRLRFWNLSDQKEPKGSATPKRGEDHHLGVKPCCMPCSKKDTLHALCAWLLSCCHVSGHRFNALRGWSSKKEVQVYHKSYVLVLWCCMDMLLCWWCPKV